MNLKLEGQTFLVQFGVWTCTAMFFLSFITFIATILVANKKLLTVNEGNGALEQKHLKNALQRQNKFNTTLINHSDLKRHRQILCSAFAGVFFSFCALMFLIATFGERAPA